MGGNHKYTHDPSAASLNKKLDKSAINKIEVKATRFSADEIRVLYIALFLLKETIVSAETSGFSDKMSEQVNATLDKSLPTFEEFVNNLIE